MDRTRVALEEMAREQPELAARLVLQTLPAVRLDGLSYDVALDGMGTWHMGNGGSPDFRIETDAEGLVAMAGGASPVGLMLRRKLRIRGSRRKAMRLRALSDGPEPTIADAVAAGAPIDADAIYRALPYLIDPEWTRGHSFTVAYVVEGEGGGSWYVHVRDGERPEVTTEGEAPDATVTMSTDTYRSLVAAEMSPATAMRTQLIEIDGGFHPVTLLGRWIDRAQGRDDAELEREMRQREVQQRRIGSWGASANGHDGDLMGYEQLYALWERQNWRAHELDFSEDREQWAASPAEAQENMTWTLGSFYIGEERVTADLAPFLIAAPTGEVEIFLATQLVDEARHAAFFDRFGAEVMALEPDDLRGRMLHLQQTMERPWFEVFDDGLRDIANRIKERPDDLDLFVEGIVTYHLIIEGVLAMTGQRFILAYMEKHGMYPGFRKGFSLVEQDEHRHIAFGVRFLKEMVERDSRYRALIIKRVEELVPKAVHVFCPPYADDPAEFVSYGYHSSQFYGFAYRKLKRRLAVLGLDAPPAEDLMPGPIASPEEARAAGAPV
ncbi:MAG: ribonucleoside-diphosphate reductase beta chain [Thermoleophilaceae bacterium]|nr:ribonucleoside-diphosphate reductase beta chain [Thermoleophilaceae bacterium]